MLHSHPQPACHSENENRSNGKPGVCSAPLARSYFAQFGEFSEAWAAGAEVLQPLVDFRQSQLAKSDASKDGRVGAPDALWIRKFTRQALRQQIQDALFFFVEFFLFAQTLPTLVEAVSRGNPKFTVGIRMQATFPAVSCHLPYLKRAASLRSAYPNRSLAWCSLRPISSAISLQVYPYTFAAQALRVQSSIFWMTSLT